MRKLALALTLCLPLSAMADTARFSPIEVLPMRAGSGHIACEYLADKYDAAWYHFGIRQSQEQVLGPDGQPVLGPDGQPVYVIGSSDYRCLGAGGTFNRGGTDYDATCPPVQRGSDCGVEDGPWHDGIGNQNVVTGKIETACYPYVEAADAATIAQLWTGDFTSLHLYRTQSPGPNARVFAHLGLASGVSLFLPTASRITARINKTGPESLDAHVDKTTIRRWMLASARLDSVDLTARLNDSSTSVSSAAFGYPSAPTLYDMQFGELNAEPLLGQLGDTCIISAPVSDADLTWAESLITGTASPHRNINTTRDAPRIAISADDIYDTFGQNLEAVTSNGMHVSQQIVNYAAHGCDSAQWTVAGTPTVSQTIEGVGQRVCGYAADTATIAGDTAEGVSFAVSADENDPITFSVHATDTSDSFTIAITDALTTIGTCAIDPSAGTCTGVACTDVIHPERYACTGIVTHAGTDTVTTTVLLDANTTSMHLALPQLEKAVHAGSLCVDFAGAAATCAADVTTVSNAGLPLKEFNVSFDYTANSAEAPVASVPLLAVGTDWSISRDENNALVVDVDGLSSIGDGQDFRETRRVCLSLFDGKARLSVDGEQVFTDAATPVSAYGVGDITIGPANGSISNLQWGHQAGCDGPMQERPLMMLVEANASDQFTIPTGGAGYDYTVDWYDVSAEHVNGQLLNQTGNATITFPGAGDYRVAVSGSFPRIRFNNAGDKDFLLDVEQWGTQVWSSFDQSFYGCINAIFTATDAPDLSNVTGTVDMFFGATAANPDTSNWNTSNITNMAFMFANATAANPDTSNWNTSNITNMAFMFANATNANPDVSGWDVSNVTNMQNMFRQATVANPDVSSWDVSNVINMFQMFYIATAANPDVSSWDVSNVTNMQNMFRQATNANPDVSGWDVSNVTNMQNMFRQATVANPDVSTWNTAKVETIQEMFSSATAANPDISGWQIPELTTATNFALNSVFSSANYNAFLLSAYAQAQVDPPGIKSDVAFHAGTAQVCTTGTGDPTNDPAAAKAWLADIANTNWTFTDAGACP